MERLTFYDDFGEPCYRIGGVVYKNEVSQRLAEYEETMLEPIEIIQNEHTLLHYKLFSDYKQLKGLKEHQIWSHCNELLKAEPVKHGRWENYPSHVYRRCSLCKVEFDKPKFRVHANYCPNCGARMDL